MQNALLDLPLAIGLEKQLLVFRVAATQGFTVCFKDVFTFPGLTVALGTVSGVLGAVILGLIAVIIALIFKLKNRGNGKIRGKSHW